MDSNTKKKISDWIDDCISGRIGSPSNPVGPCIDELLSSGRNEGDTAVWDSEHKLADLDKPLSIRIGAQGSILEISEADGVHPAPKVPRKSGYKSLERAVRQALKNQNFDKTVDENAMRYLVTLTVPRRRVKSHS